MIQVEKLLATTGIWPSGDHPNANDLLASAGITATWKARIKRWLSASAADDYQPTEFDIPEPPEAEKLQDKILKPIEGEEDARLLSSFGDPVIASEYLELVQRARAYIDGKWPKIDVPGSLGDVFPPSTEELYDIWAITRVLDDPEVLLEELEMQSVTIPMIEAWRAIYPEFSAEVLGDFALLMNERHAAKKMITWQQLDLFRMFAGVALSEPVKIEVAKPKKTEQPQQATATE